MAQPPLQLGRYAPVSASRRYALTDFDLLLCNASASVVHVARSVVLVRVFVFFPPVFEYSSNFTRNFTSCHVESKLPVIDTSKSRT